MKLKLLWGGLAAAFLAFILSACGIEGAGNSGAFMPADDHGGKVWCVGNSSSGVSCNWDQYNFKNGIVVKRP